jgi:hypothetical protein
VQVCKRASDLWNEANTVYCFVVPPSKISCHWLQPVVDDGTFLSAEFIRRKILEGASPDAPNFSAVREHCPPENHSLFATRYSLPFWLKSVSTKTKPAKAG